jgi:hypothetical protein
MDTKPFAPNTPQECDWQVHEVAAAAAHNAWPSLGLVGLRKSGLRERF